MSSLYFHLPTRLFAGGGALRRAASDISPRLGNRAMLVSDELTVANRISEPVVSQLDAGGIETIVFDEIGTEALSTVADNLLEMVRSCRAQLVIAVGDTPALNVARSVCDLVFGDFTIDDLLDGNIRGDKAPLAASIPYVEIPATIWNPLMLQANNFLIDARDRSPRIISSRYPPDSVILDPISHSWSSEKERTYRLIDALLVALEAYFSDRTTFLEEPELIRALSILVQLLRGATNQPEARDSVEPALRGALLAGLGSSSAGIGLGSAICYVLHARCTVPAHLISPIILPGIIARLTEIRPTKVPALARILGVDENGGGIEEELRSIVGANEIPLRLSNFDISSKDIENVGDAVERLGIYQSSPLSLDSEGIVGLLGPSI